MHPLTAGIYTTADVPGIADTLEKSVIEAGKWVPDKLNPAALRSRDDSFTLPLAYILAIECLRVRHGLARPLGHPSDRVIRGLRKRLHPEARRREGDARCTACREPARISKSVHAWIGCWEVDGGCAACIACHTRWCRFDEERDEHLHTPRKASYSDERPPTRRKTSHVPDSSPEQATMPSREPATAGPITVHTERASPEEPATIEEPGRIEEPGTIEEPATVEEPVAAAEPAAAESVALNLVTLERVAPTVADADPLLEQPVHKPSKPHPVKMLKLSLAAADVITLLVVQWQFIHRELATTLRSNDDLTTVAALLAIVTKFSESAHKLKRCQDVPRVYRRDIWENFVPMDCLIKHAVRLRDAQMMEEVLGHATSVHEGVYRLAAASGFEGMLPEQM